MQTKGINKVTRIFESDAILTVWIWRVRKIRNLHKRIKHNISKLNCFNFSKANRIKDFFDLMIMPIWGGFLQRRVSISCKCWILLITINEFHTNIPTPLTSYFLTLSQILPKILTLPIRVLFPLCGFCFTQSSTISFHFLHIIKNSQTQPMLQKTTLISSKNYNHVSSITWQVASPIGEHRLMDVFAADSRSSRCQFPTQIKNKSSSKQN